MARKPDPWKADAEEALAAGVAMVSGHPLFARLWTRASLVRPDQSSCPPDGWVLVTPGGNLHVSQRRAEPAEWAHVLAHCLLHLGFEHFQERKNEKAWNAACDCVVEQFLSSLKVGSPPEEIRLVETPPSRDLEQLYAIFDREGVPEPFAALGTGGRVVDMWRVPDRTPAWVVRQSGSWPKLLQEGIRDAVSRAVRVAGGGGGDEGLGSSVARKARGWFISSYPLFGAMAESFRIVEDLAVCRGSGITVAAVNASAREIYMNPAAGLNEQEARFVMAHEMLHVGLRHDVRQGARDAFLWNVACDYVINGWLIEMGIGTMPAFGGLYDPELKGLSAEAIYDRIACDLRRYRKLATLRGVGAGDILEGPPRWWAHGEGVSLDEFYRSCLARGMLYHEQQGRGLLPAGLVEEIAAVQQPAIPWDVELARWFDAHFSPLERRRSYARPSRRQSATPDIPRASWHLPEDELLPRTFGVVIDTSGSMEQRMLAIALGAVASYAASREVARVRVVFCDAAAYDAGYMSAEEIAGRVRVRGRGGTVLRPGIRLLEQAEDFPQTGPILIITDGVCDRFTVNREHAFLMPAGNRLPFAPQGPVFHMPGKGSG
jgi:predicted metal-dependent peptidase